MTSDSEERPPGRGPGQPGGPENAHDDSADDTSRLETAPQAQRVAAFGPRDDRRVQEPPHPAAPRPILPPDIVGARQPRPAPPQEAYEPALLRNPYVLAGIAVFGAILLAVAVVFILGSKGSATSTDSGASASTGVSIQPLTPLPGRGVAVRPIASATVREGPALEYGALGELVRGQEIEVVGRNSDGSWFSIYYPPGSNLGGWVPKTALNLPGDLLLIPLANVTPLPRPTVPTSTPAPEPTQAPTGTVTPTGTPVPGNGPNLVASVAPGSCVAGQRLVINVRNAGPGTLISRPINILVQTPDGAQLSLNASPVVNLGPGQAIDIDTTYVVTQHVVVVVDPLQALGDPNPANNRVDCAVAAVATPNPALPTAVPFRTATPTVNPFLPRP